jgi:hypothetical protein
MGRFIIFVTGCILGYVTSGYVEGFMDEKNEKNQPQAEGAKPHFGSIAGFAEILTF